MGGAPCRENDLPMITVRTGPGRLGDYRYFVLSSCSVAGTGLGTDVRVSQMGGEDERRLPNLGDQRVERLVSD